MDDEELEAKEESLASDWANYYPSAFFPFLPQWPADPGNRDRAPSPHSPGPWPPFLSDEESGPKVLLTWEGEESLEEGEGKATQKSQRRRCSAAELQERGLQPGCPSTWRTTGPEDSATFRP